MKFTRGLTNLRGALNDVHTIFRKLINEPTTNFYRPNANKVVMLLSDGKGNIDEKGRVNPFTGNDVTAEMRRIRSFGEVEVYSVAVTNETDQTTLRDKVATIPSFFMYQPDEQALVEISRFIRGGRYEMISIAKYCPLLQTTKKREEGGWLYLQSLQIDLKKVGSLCAILYTTNFKHIDYCHNHYFLSLFEYIRS